MAFAQQTPRGGRGSGQTPQRQRPGHTPRRERPGQAPQGTGYTYYEQPVPVFSPEDFPELPSSFTMLPRGRKDRRSAYEWKGRSQETARTRSLSRSEEPEDAARCEKSPFTARGRCRAKSCDLEGWEEKVTAQQPDELAEKAQDKQPERPRSILKVNLLGNDGVGVPASSGIEETLALKRQMEAMAAVHQRQMAAMAQKVAAMERAHGIEADAEIEPEKQLTDEGTRARRRSNPTQPVADPEAFVMEPPHSNSWDFPMSRDEKKARVVMIDRNVKILEIDTQNEKIDTLESELEKARINSTLQ